LNALASFAAQLGSRRLMIMGGVAAALLLLLGTLALRGPSAEMGFLYTDLDPAGAQAITEKLSAQGVPFQLSADGTSVMAPRERLAELRMALAGEQLGGRIGYDVLDQEEPFGVSASRAKLNETRAIEGELARSIQSLQNVSAARVHIVMPERAMFAAQARKATAAVTVKTRGRLSGENVQAVRHLVAASVPELSPESVSIVDQSGALLARAGESGAAGASDLDERQSGVEARLRSQIEAMVEPIVGQGKVRAEVSVELDRDSSREEASLVDPDRQAIARQVTVESADQNQESDPGAMAASVAGQLPENQDRLAGPPQDRRRSARNENSEDTTYENSRTSTVTVRTPGRVKRVTVAVLLDGGAQGVPEAQLRRITRLVENAVGFDAERGDSVAVESMAFAAAEEMADGDFLSSFPTGQIFDLLKYLILAGVALLALRMLRQRRVGDAPPALPGPAAGPLALEAGAAGGEALTDERADPNLLDQEIALAQVDGRIKVSALQRIGGAVSASPAESASVIRQWMNS
jgi:flagellar M-ring protein FliF